MKIEEYYCDRCKAKVEKTDLKETVIKTFGGFKRELELCTDCECELFNVIERYIEKRKA